jgi:hypothetical protein
VQLFPPLLHTYRGSEKLNYSVYGLFQILEPKFLQAKQSVFTCMSDSGRCCSYHFNTQLVIALNYSALANFHSLQITLSFFQPVVSSLVVA